MPVKRAFSPLVSLLVLTAVLGSSTAAADSDGGAHALAARKHCRRGLVLKHGRCVHRPRPAAAAIKSGHFGSPVNINGQYHFIEVDTAKKTATFVFRLLCQSGGSFSTLSNAAAPTKIALPSTHIGQAVTFAGSSTAGSPGATTMWTAAGKFTAPASWLGSIRIVFDVPANPANQTAGAHCEQTFPRVTMSIGDGPLS